jgi:hypothetical protein
MADMHTGDPGLGKRGPQDPGGKVAERKRAEEEAKTAVKTNDAGARLYEFTLDDLQRVFHHAEKRLRRSPSDFVSEDRYNAGPAPFAAQGKCDRFIRFAKEIGLMP